MNLVCDRKERKPRRYTEENKTEFIVRIKPKLIRKDCARSIIVLKLTTDRHEASRGLSATDELLVGVHKFLFVFHSNYGAILYRLRDTATYW